MTVKSDHRLMRGLKYWFATNENMNKDQFIALGICSMDVTKGRISGKSIMDVKL